MEKGIWYIYLTLCTDNSLYCGITINVVRRIFEHNYSKKGAKYTKSRRHVLLVYVEKIRSKSEALKREFVIKKMSRKQKDKLRKNWIPDRTLWDCSLPGVKKATHRVLEE